MTTILDQKVFFAATLRTVPETAAFMRVSRRHIYRLIKENDLQTRRVGRRSMRVVTSSVRALMEQTEQTD